MQRARLSFAHLRYNLGGDRPSQTTNHTWSLFSNKRNKLIEKVRLIRVFQLSPPQAASTAKL